MSKPFVIEPGYIFEASSWENDGDNYVTARITGLTELDVRFLAELCDAAKSGPRGSIDGIGNLRTDYQRPEHVEKATKKLVELVKKHRNASCVKALFDEGADIDVLFTDQEIEDQYLEVLDLLYYLLRSIGMCSSDYLLRVCESYDVYFSTQRCEFPNLTHKFSKK